MFYLMFACVWLFKFWSYHHIWHDVRYHVIKANKITQTEENNTSNKKSPISKKKLEEKLDLPGKLVDEILSYPSNVRVKDVWMF